MLNRYIFLLLLSVIGFGQSKIETLPKPFATKSTGNYSNVIGWKDGQKPIAPPGFIVTKYADGFENPRWMYVTPNGDVLVAQSNSNFGFWKKIGAAIIGVGKSNNLKKSADIITLLRDTNQDGIPEIRETFLTKGLKQPLGMLVIDNWFYVANTDALMRFPYTFGQTKINGKGEKLTKLPAGKPNQHWSRNIIANADNSKIYIAVGCATNIGEKGMDKEFMRASILEVNADGSGLRIYASGLRNPVGMDWAPGTKTLWTTVNERDGLGDELVPDYLTSVKENGFYGWPYAYFGQHIDPRVKDQKPDLVSKTIVPDVSLGAHTASLGLVFYTKTAFPKKYQGGAFVAQHGSWNRKQLSGYVVAFIPFENGKAGVPEDFLTGFIVDPRKDEVRGRPVGLAMLPDGALLLTDDKTNTIWHIQYK